jgi:membrane protein YdbS with pleckstrin-like domain
MFPAMALAAVASLLVWTGRWYLEDLSAFADAVGDWAIFALAWAVWPALAIAFLSKTVMHTYRLTSRAVLVDYGRFSRPVPPIPLESITAVDVRGGWVLRQLGIGRIELRTGDREVILTGVRNPEEFAERIRTARAEMTPLHVSNTPAG